MSAHFLKPDCFLAVVKIEHAGEYEEMMGLSYESMEALYLSPY